MSIQQTNWQDERRGSPQRFQEEWDAPQQFERQDVHSLEQGRFIPAGGWQEESAAVDPAQLATGLGWFSIGLGLAQLAAPRQVAQLIGVEDTDESQSLLRAIGVREIVSGLGILTQPAGRRSDWVKARVGGDVMDLALLGRALAAGDNDQGKVTAALAAVAGVTAVDLFVSRQLSSQENDQWQPQAQAMGGQWQGEGEGRRGGASFGDSGQDRSRQGQQQMAVGEEEKGIHIVKAVTINRPAEDLYTFWRNFENLPRFMSHVQSVQVTDDRRSHWKVNAPAGTSVEWDAEITDDQPNSRIAWQSLPGALTPNAGSVRFERATGNRGTRVIVELQYDPPLGKIGATVAKLLGEEPEKQVYDELRAFKQVMEIGEVTRSDGSPWGNQLAQRPAQPLSDEEIAKHAAA
jgi:uncharacterized membrane protein